MKREQAEHVIDMLVAAREAVGYADGLSFRAFVSDRRTQRAVLTCIGIVAEAASRIDMETRRAHPAVPWREIRGLRERLVRADFDIDPRPVRQTLRGDLPKLIVRLERMLAQEGR